jgi:hypothetical protein
MSRYSLFVDQTEVLRHRQHSPNGNDEQYHNKADDSRSNSGDNMMDGELNKHDCDKKDGDNLDDNKDNQPKISRYNYIIRRLVTPDP